MLGIHICRLFYYIRLGSLLVRNIFIFFELDYVTKFRYFRY